MSTLHVAPVVNQEQWAMARAIRTEVFIHEQACPPEEEWDGFDDTSRHFIGFDDGEPVATARWRTVAHDEHLVAKLERFAVRAPYRGCGFGRALVAYVVADAERAGFGVQLIHAQAHLEGFYTTLGFERTDDPPFEEAGIPHVTMVRTSRSK